MAPAENRRDFLKAAGAGVAGLTAADALTQEPAAAPPQTDPVNQFSRWYPSQGGPPDSPTYKGKQVPGFRAAGLPPVPVETPDVPRATFQLVNGWKEFHLHAENVRRELLPDTWADVYGFNGSSPGPTVEVVQGDRVRVIVHNRLDDAITFGVNGAGVRVSMAGVPNVTQRPIPPGQSYTYEYTFHEAGTFFYRSHHPLQRGQGLIGFFIIQPQIAFDPPVDRDFALAFQDWLILPNNTVPFSYERGGPFRSVNGRVAPYTTPLVVQHGERVRVRVANFSKVRPHAIHLHGHTFWITGLEGSRNPTTAWTGRNTTLIHALQSSDLEFIAYNPGDWMLHCRMTNHMLNFTPMGRTPGPRMREGESVDQYRRDRTERPAPQRRHTDPGHAVPGYPLHLLDQGFTPAQVRKLLDRREVRGMREDWFRWMGGLETIVRVLPEELYDRVMHGDDDPRPGEIFQAVAEGKERWRRGRIHQ